MATATVKFHCITCSKEKVAYKCECCSQYFSVDHLSDHHKSLVPKIGEIERNRNVFQQTLNEQRTDLKKHLLMQQINRWKQDSIKKIEQTARECEELLVKPLQEHIDKMQIELDKFTEQLKQIRKKNDFKENILIELIQKLKKLEEELNKPSNITIEQDSSSFINEISVIIISFRDEQFAAPGFSSQLHCKGRSCAKCGECRDWYYTGDAASWRWIRNVENWNKSDWERYANDRVWERLKKRDGATCGVYGHHVHGGHYFAPHCLCRDNVRP